MSLTNKLILIVEDDEMCFTLIHHIMKKTGAISIRASNGQQAVALCKTEPVDLVLMDIRMPVMDGCAATRLIKKDNPKLPVIAVTTVFYNHDTANVLEAGCDQCISKPFENDFLIESAKKHLLQFQN